MNMVLLLSLLANAPENLLAADFEAGAAGWQHRDGATYDVDPQGGQDGSGALRIVVPAGAELAWQQWFRPVPEAREGDQFRCSVAVRTQGVTDGTGAYAAFEFVNAQGERMGIAHSTIGAPTETGWQTLQWSGVAPKGTTAARLSLILHGHGTAWFDNARVERTGRIEPWPDLGDATREVVVRTKQVTQPNFAGVGFHVFHHTFDMPDEMVNQHVAKAWRELNPSFARLNHGLDWDDATIAQIGTHLKRYAATGTELYLATWGPPQTKPGAERQEYAQNVVASLQKLIAAGGSTIKWFCMSNELSLGNWGAMYHDLPLFEDYHRELHRAFAASGLKIGLLATDASPVQRWDSVKWAADHMDDVTEIYGGHHYINDRPLDDERFYGWWHGELSRAVAVARSKGKEFILGEFGAKQDGRTVDGVKLDRCVHYETDQEKYVALQLADAVIASLDAGVYALGYWTFMDFPDDYRPTYINKWGLLRWSGDDHGTRDPYYGYGLLSKFFRGPATVYHCDVNDPWLRAAAVKHHGRPTWSVAVLNRAQRAVPLHLVLDGSRTSASFRRYVYDPADVLQHPFGDLQAPDRTVAMRGGDLVDTIPANSLVVYTTVGDEQPPRPIPGLKVTEADGKVTLTWDASGAEDLCYYRIYRNVGEAASPVLSQRIGSTVATHFVDEQPPAGERQYLVVAVDQSGNPYEPR